MTHRRIPVLAVLTAVLLLQPAAPAAGDIWIEPDQGGEVRLEAVKPSFDGAEFSTFSLAWFLSVRTRTGVQTVFHADLPYVHVADSGGRHAANSVGNPFVGFELGPRQQGFCGEFGLRLPFSSGEGDGTGALAFGVLSEFVDRMEAFYPDILPITIGASYRTRTDGGFGLRLRVAPVFWIDLDEALDDPAELWVRYSAQAHYRVPGAVVGAGLTGRYLGTSGRSGDLGLKTMHELDLYLNLVPGRLRPSFRLRIPLDKDLTDFQNPSFVISLGYAPH